MYVIIATDTKDRSESFYNRILRTWYYTSHRATKFNTEEEAISNIPAAAKRLRPGRFNFSVREIANETGLDQVAPGVWVRKETK